jgi:hypothetical protein
MSKPTIPDVIDRFRAYHAKPENSVWGSLHIVLEDMNIKDSSILFCKQWAKDHNDPEGEALADILLTLSWTQRRKLYRIVG